MSNLPIGVFDSGIGGLSVLKCIRQQLPHENLFYLADSAFAPYGKRPVKEIQDRCVEISEFLLAQGAKAIVVACNTATAAAIEHLRQRLEIPVIGMEPGIKPALTQTRNKVIAVLATDNTLTSSRFESLIKRFNIDANIIIQPCTHLVEEIEKGDFDSTEIHTILSSIMPQLKQKNTDVIVLGCSHYPLIQKQIEQHAGPSITVINTGNAIANEIQRRLANANIVNTTATQGDVTLWSSSDNPHKQRIIKSVWPTQKPIGFFDTSPEPHTVD